MPELPDVARFKKYLDATALHQTVAASECTDKRFIKETSRRGLQRKLKGAALERSRRWGKWLFAELSTKGNLVLHFGMTGELDYGRDEGDLPEHTRLALHFENGRRLAVISQRMIGEASYAESVERFAEEHDLGPDALDVGRDTFLERMSARRGSVKSGLMDQSFIAGIGNVYSDEILFQAGIHPAEEARELDETALRTLYRVMRRVLQTAARRGDGRKAPRRWLLGKRSAEHPCPRCHGQLRSLKINGRTSWFCPDCQPGA